MLTWPSEESRELLLWIGQRKVASGAEGSTLPVSVNHMENASQSPSLTFLLPYHLPWATGSMPALALGIHLWLDREGTGLVGEPVLLAAGKCLELYS